MAKQKSVSDSVAERLADVAQLQADAEVARLRAELATYQKRYKAALAQIDAERERESPAGRGHHDPSGRPGRAPAATASRVRHRRHILADRWVRD